MSNEQMANAPQDTVSSHSQAIPAIKLRRSNKPPAVKAAVLVQRASGVAKAKISRDLGITRPTVDVIIAEADLDRQMESGQLLSVQLIPEAIRVAKHRLSQNSENMAIKVLENTIWPIQGKQGKAGDPGLVLAIQNLMGNITVQSQGNQQDKLVKSETGESKPVSTEPLAIMQTSPQVVENKE